MNHQFLTSKLKSILKYYNNEKIRFLRILSNTYDWYQMIGVPDDSREKISSTSKLDQNHVYLNLLLFQDRGKSYKTLLKSFC